jgi:exosortase
VRAQGDVETATLYKLIKSIMASNSATKADRFSSTLYLGLASALAVCIAWAYWPVLAAMVHKWTIDAQYSHGFLVPIFACVLLWLRRNLYQPGPARLRWLGLGLLAIGLGLYLYGTYIFIQWYEAISLIACVAGVCFLLGGWSLFRWAWPSVAFLAFMIPLPYRIEMAFCERLQAVAAVASTFCLQTLGFPALRVGTNIQMGRQQVSVEKACSGLSMLMTFFCLSTAVALLVNRPLWQKIVVVISAIPIALVSNITRVMATVILFQLTSSDWVRHKAHEWAGWMMMVLGLILLGLELRYLSYLVPPALVRGPVRPEQKPLLSRSFEPSPKRKGSSPRPRPAAGTA